jgi:uncharacterized protein with NAD-binding domain and iron-sulfur cluster
MTKKVVILGGGVAGMSAAHELAERGFHVAVYETRDIPGGKARSIPVPNSATIGKKQLPGEHGFRFFPGFYQHITDTMKRIPYKNNPLGVFNNLVDATRINIPRFDKEGLTLPAKAPTSSSDVQVLVTAFLQFMSDKTELKEGELTFFAGKLWQLITSCKERRIGEYEKVDWWTFVEADRFSPEYKNLLAKGLTESLVASKAKLASTKTVGDIFLQLLLDMVNPAISTDRLLNGPTNEVWVYPWLAHLQTFGVDYHFNSLVIGINCENGQIKSATIRDLNTQETYEVKGDYYIAAFPVEVMAQLINKNNLDRYDPTLKNVQTLAKNVAWMNGIQFYLKEDVPIAYGHILLVDTPWALTAISQKQFWRNVDLSEYGDGQVKGILSVDISDWGPFGEFQEEHQESIGIKIKKYAKDCTDEEIKEEVWEQLKRSFNVNGQEILKDENLHAGVPYFLDPDIVDPEKEIFQWITLEDVHQVTLKEVAEHIHEQEEDAEKLLQALIDLGYVREIKNPGEPTKYESVFNVTSKINLEPLLVNLVNTWQLRPDAFTQIPNLFLASDYVRTNTDLATMEGANEAARRAVNAIIEASGAAVPLCQIWELHEPEFFAPLRWHDTIRYQMGLPWQDLLQVKPLLNELAKNIKPLT